MLNIKELEEQNGGILRAAVNLQLKIRITLASAPNGSAGRGLPLSGLPYAVSEPSKNESRRVVESALTWNDEHCIQSIVLAPMNVKGNLRCFFDDLNFVHQSRDTGCGLNATNKFTDMSIAGLIINYDKAICFGWSALQHFLLCWLLGALWTAASSSKKTRASRSRSRFKFLKTQPQRRLGVALLCSTLLFCWTTAALTNKEAVLSPLIARRLDPVTVTSLKQLREAVAVAPTDGSTQTVIEVDGNLPAWTSEDGMDDSYSIVVVKAGQNVVVRGTSTSDRYLLDAQGSSSS